MRTSTAVGHAALLATLIAAAACGGGGATGAGPQTPTGPGTPGTSTAPTATGATGATTSPTASPTATGTGAQPAPAAGAKAINASAFASELKEIGLDGAKLPPLNKMEPDKLRKVMKTFSKALGVQCTGCHDGNDFRAPTKNKKIASKMWDQYVRGLAFEDGSALYCDSCHQGKMEFLDRHDKKALGAWMDANFVTKLKRTDKKDNGCETCHGEDMDMHFLAKWAK